MRALLDYVIAIPLALLPRRRWDDWNLPIENVTFVSALLTFFAGAAYGITGFFAYMAWFLAKSEWTAPPLMIVVYLTYVTATPRGLFSVYLGISGILRMISWYIDEPSGDPIITGIDALISRTKTSQRQRSARVERERLEGAAEPDRRYDGEWAGLTGVDFVIVAARRKPGWTKGTWVTTNDGWFVLGEPFDRPMPNGVRTVYPLTLSNTLEVVRRSVQYELPPLRISHAPGRSAETPKAIGES